MTDPIQNCPDSLELVMYGSHQLCGKKTDRGACDSIMIPLNGQATYTQVRGRLKGFQFGSIDAFTSRTGSIDGIYIDGVSITYGQNPRKHVWSFGVCQSQYWTDRSTCPGTGYGNAQPMFVRNN